MSHRNGARARADLQRKSKMHDRERIREIKKLLPAIAAKKAEPTK
jgi:hypothetical protein